MMERPTKCDACLDTEEKKCSSQICENHSLRWCCPRSCKCFNTKAHVSKPGYQLVVKQTGTTGLGLFTKQNIPANKFICEYLGEVLSTSMYIDRLNSIYVNHTNFYAASIGKNQVIDATRFGSVARHANSSHEPNAIIEVWNINGLPKLYLFSLKLIKADSEITFFYNLQMLGTEKRQVRYSSFSVLTIYYFFLVQLRVSCYSGMLLW